MDGKQAFVRRIALRNYKSIEKCDVGLGPLTFLVGPNGSGKSNVLDSLRFVADALRTTLDHALRDRGGIGDVRRRSGGHPTHFAIRLDLRLNDDSKCHYAFRVGARPQAGFEVQQEECVIEDLQGISRFVAVPGQVRASTPAGTLSLLPAPASDRLYLVAASGLPPFAGVYAALSTMGFYNFNPDEMRDLQSPDPGELLARDGSNIASVMARLADRDPAAKQRIEEYLSSVVAGVSEVDRYRLGPKETLEFRQEVPGALHPWRFLAAAMSDGTLRALGILAALNQTETGAPPVRLVGIEEPETALHPAAAAALRDALQDASKRTQVIVTSHSPDLLDDDAIAPESVLAVISERGVTKVAELDAASQNVLRKHLYTPGELLKLNQLQPDLRAANRRLPIFEETDA